MADKKSDIVRRSLFGTTQAVPDDEQSDFSECGQPGPLASEMPALDGLCRQLSSLRPRSDSWRQRVVAPSSERP